jgi:hypothetical protein
MKDRNADRRTHPRSRGGFKLSGAGSAGQLISHVDNISCSGVLCHTQRPVVEMTKLSIVLDLPGPVDRVVNAEGIVIRCEAEYPKRDDFRVAILYTKLSDEDHHAIRAYVEHDLGEHAPRER